MLKCNVKIKKVEKVCTKCGLMKPISQFTFQNRAKGYRKSRCRVCSVEDCMVCFAKNRKRYTKVSYRSMKRRRLEHTLKVYKYLLEHPCVDCGETEPIVLEFDHVRGKKVKDVTRMVGDCHSWGLIELEIKKCDVRCANCHRLRTARLPGTTLYQKWNKISNELQRHSN